MRKLNGLNLCGILWSRKAAGTFWLDKVFLSFSMMGNTSSHKQFLKCVLKKLQALLRSPINNSPKSHVGSRLPLPNPQQSRTPQDSITAVASLPLPSFPCPSANSCSSQSPFCQRRESSLLVPLPHTATLPWKSLITIGVQKLPHKPCKC